MASEDILGVDVHDAIMGLKRAIDNNRLKIKSAYMMDELDNIRLGANGLVDPATVGLGVRATARAYIDAHPDDWATR